MRKAIRDVIAEHSASLPKVPILFNTAPTGARGFGLSDSFLTFVSRARGDGENSAPAALLLDDRVFLARCIQPYGEQMIQENPRLARIVASYIAHGRQLQEALTVARNVYHVQRLEERLVDARIDAVRRYTSEEFNNKHPPDDECDQRLDLQELLTTNLPFSAFSRDLLQSIDASPEALQAIKSRVRADVEETLGCRVWSTLSPEARAALLACVEEEDRNRDAGRVPKDLLAKLQAIHERAAMTNASNAIKNNNNFTNTNVLEGFAFAEALARCNTPEAEDISQAFHHQRTFERRTAGFLATPMGQRLFPPPVDPPSMAPPQKQVLSETVGLLCAAGTAHVLEIGYTLHGQQWELRESRNGAEWICVE